MDLKTKSDVDISVEWGNLGPGPAGKVAHFDIF